ncbi:Pet127-domain-containing protein [Neoconidiobolus thromboides FSU 785]|nr:Pet127-domain-containing protein [Neoconidiobolus thromboides FSU 785]
MKFYTNVLKTSSSIVKSVSIKRFHNVRVFQQEQQQEDSLIDVMRKQLDIQEEDLLEETKKNKKKKKKKNDMEGIQFSKMNSRNFKLKSMKQNAIKDLPRLKFGLDRALFNPGVTYLQDPNSKVYNFDPYLESILDIDEFNFDKIQGYIPAGEDELLQQIAAKNDKKYIATTSSITRLLCHISFVITNWRTIDTSTLGSEFSKMTKRYSRTLTCPCSIVLEPHENGVYSINSDKSMENGDSVLSKLGQLMERMLTQEPSVFSKYSQSSNSSVEEIEKNSIYNYSFYDKFALRSQLDCIHPWLPKKVFDLKTRAALPIRLDKENYKDYLGYQIKYLNGKMQSFEREYYDLMRSAFMKYNYQVRIGNMDGCMVAYHNTSQIFGFQYISLKEMDEKLFGNSILADQTFGNSVQLLQQILDRITFDYPNKKLIVTLKSLQDSLILDIFVNVIENETFNPHPDNLVIKYQLICYSEVNGEKVITPIELNDKKMKWDIHYVLRKVEDNPLNLYNDYVKLRLLIANFFTGDLRSLPWLKQLRNLVLKKDLAKDKSKVRVFR